MKFFRHYAIEDRARLTGWGWLIVSCIVVLASFGLAYLSKWAAELH